jgi:hypothetical protein
MVAEFCPPSQPLCLGRLRLETAPKLIFGAS